MPKPRILIIGPSLDILGGQSRQAAWLLSQFTKEECIEVRFLAVNPRLPRPFQYLQRVKYLRTIVTTLTYWAHLWVRVPSADVLHIFSASYFSYLQCALPPILIGRLLGKKTLLNYHSGEAEDHLQRWRWTAAPGIRLADAVVVPSNYLVNVFAKFGIHAMPILNTVDLTRFVFRDRRRLAPRLLSTRLLEPLYNVSCILRAFAIVQQRYPEATLTIAGDGSERSSLERLAAKLALRHTVFVGGVPHEHMPALYDAADVYLTVNNVDNMPVSVLEAFASGLPVIAADVGGVPYIVTNNATGLLVPPNNPDATAEAVIRLLEDPELAARITHAARSECEQYRWSIIRPQWLQVYALLAPGGSNVGL